MRIKEFALAHGITERTLRYYVDQRLLCPEKENGRLDFDEACTRALAEVERLKACGLTIAEIQTWFEQERSQMPAKEKRDAHLAILREKRAQRTEEIAQLRKTLERLAARLEGMPQSTDQKGHGGSSLRMLEYVCCPVCGRLLEYHDLHIVNNEIVSGRADCVCGYQLSIRDGIFTVLQAAPDLPVIVPLDHHRETYNRLPPSEVSQMQANYNWVLQHLQSLDLAGKVIFENSMDVVNFLSTGISRLDPMARYIIADSDFEVLSEVKRRIDALKMSPTVLYIAASNLQFPIRQGCVDVLLDFYTTEILQRLNIPTLVQAVRGYLHPDAHLVGTFIYVKKGTKTLLANAKRYPNSYKDRYRLPALRENFTRCGVNVLEGEETETGGGTAALDTYQEGNQLGIYRFWGTLGAHD